MLNPLKLPMKAWLPPKARSEVTKPKSPGLAGSTKPGRLVEVGEQLEVADRRLGVEPARTETDPRVVVGLGAGTGGGENPGHQRGGCGQSDQPPPAAASTYDITRHVSGLPRARRPPRSPIRALECAVRLRTVVRPPELGDELSCHHGGDELWDVVPAHPPGVTAVVDRYVRPTGQETPVPPRPQ